jgi:hypothetical protein
MLLLKHVPQELCRREPMLECIPTRDRKFTSDRRRKPSSLRANWGEDLRHDDGPDFYPGLRGLGEFIASPGEHANAHGQGRPSPRAHAVGQPSPRGSNPPRSQRRCPCLVATCLNSHAAPGCCVGALWPVAPTSRTVPVHRRTAAKTRGWVNSAKRMSQVFEGVNTNTNLLP